MSGILLLVLCPVIGMLAARRRWMPPNAPATINAWLIRVALPCVILEQIPQLHFDARLLLPLLGPFVLMFSTMAVMAVLARRLGWDRGTQGAMTLCWGLGNTSFVGFPLLLAIIGPPAMGAALIADQATFLALTLIGLPVAAYFAGQTTRPIDLIKRVLMFTPFLALIVAGIAAALLDDGHWPEPVDVVLKRLGDTLTPLALAAVGFQFKPGAARRYAGLIGIGAAWKMLLLPALMWGGALAMGLHGMPITIGILQVAMAPMITAGILASEHGLAPELSSALVSVGIAMSFVTVPLWALVIGGY